MKKGRKVTNVRIREIMRERNCSRQWAYKLWHREVDLEKDMSRATRMSTEEERHLRDAGVIR